MPPGNPLYDKIVAIVQEVLDEMQQTTPNTDPQAGVVTVVNPDGTVDVQGSQGGLYQGVGACTAMTVGTQVTIIVADGSQVAIPRGAQTTY